MPSVDAPPDKAAAPSDLSRGAVPLILQVSPLPGSLDPEEFYYDPFSDAASGDFAAAWAFFIFHGHTVVYHECPDTSAFQELFPSAKIGCLSSLPAGLLREGHHLLSEHGAALQAATLPEAAPCSLVDRYAAMGFGHMSPPTDPSGASLRSGGSSMFVRLRHPSGSHRPDPNGYDTVPFHGWSCSYYGGSFARTDRHGGYSSSYGGI